MAEPESNNLLRKESTRVQGIISINGAHSLNADNWKRMIKIKDKMFDLMIKGFFQHENISLSHL